MKSGLLKYALVAFAIFYVCNAQAEQREKPIFPDRLQIGRYGEVVGTYNFFNDEYLRYTDAKSYKDAPGHGRIDIPHFVIWLGYDFGKGWSPHLFSRHPLGIAEMVPQSEAFPYLLHPRLPERPRYIFRREFPAWRTIQLCLMQ